MTAAVTAADRAAIDALVTTLETAWNNGDGDAFAAPFADDADFVNTRAEHHRGRAAIAAGHTGIFRAIYAGSKNRNAVQHVCLLRDDIAVVHVEALLDVPAGPLAGHHRALFSMVLVKTTPA